MRYDENTGELFNAKGKPLTLDGKEIPDSTPIAPPVGYVKRDSLAEQIRQMVVSERLAQEAARAGAETFDEADDFDVGDDYDPRSPYEANFDPMTPEERAALRSKGKAVDDILGPPPKPRKTKSSPVQGEPVTEAPGEPQSGDPE